MNWEAKIIEYLQNTSSSFSDVLMLFLTSLGSEIVFLVVIVALYWCVNKRLAYKFFNVYIFSVAATSFLKIVIGRARPYDKYSKSIISIGEKTGGGSFPSGHSQSIANLSTQSYLNSREYRSTMLVAGIVLTVIVMFSRMYLGQHYLTDVIVGAACGIGFAFVFSLLFELIGNKEEFIAVLLFPLSLAVTIVLQIINPHGFADVMKVLGAVMAFSGGYFLEKRYVKFDPKAASAGKNFLKLVIGLSVGLGIKEGLKFVFPENITFLYDFLRYFIVAAWASIGACSLFKALKL